MFCTYGGYVSNCLQLNVGDHAFHETFSLSPTPSAPLGYHRLAQRGNAAQTVLCFRSCIEAQVSDFRKAARASFLRYLRLSAAYASNRSFTKDIRELLSRVAMKLVVLPIGHVKDEEWPFSLCTNSDVLRHNHLLQAEVV